MTALGEFAPVEPSVRMSVKQRIPDAQPAPLAAADPGGDITKAPTSARGDTADIGPDDG